MKFDKKYISWQLNIPSRTGNHSDGTRICITCGTKFYQYDILSRTGNHTDGTQISITSGAKFCQQYDILSRTGNHTDKTSINITSGATLSFLYLEQLLRTFEVLVVNSVIFVKSLAHCKHCYCSSKSKTKHSTRSNG